MEKQPFPHDATPDVHAFSSPPENVKDLINRYGTYNIQPTGRHGECVSPHRAGPAPSVAENASGQAGSGGVILTRHFKASL